MAVANWDLYRSFLMVMQEGSLSAAARQLGLTQPTLGHHIGQLEASLKQPLFVRSQRGLVPTEAARSLLPYAETMAAAADALIRTASGGQNTSTASLTGTVRLSASEVIGVEVLPPMLTDFRTSQPGIAIELTLDNRLVDLTRQDADIAIRMVKPAQLALRAKAIGSIELGLYATPAYLARKGTPQALSDLVGHDLIGYDRETLSLGAIKDPQGHSLDTGQWPRDIFALRADNQLAQIAALRAGFGIGVCQTGIARQSAPLVRLLADTFAPRMGCWLVMHENLRDNRAVRALFDHLVATMTSYAKVGGPENPLARDANRLL